MTNPGEPYVIAWSAPARRAIAHVPEKAAAAIIEFVYGALVDNPPRVGRALRWELEGLHVARRGDHWIVYHLDTERRVIVIEALGHRSDIYRRR